MKTVTFFSIEEELQQLTGLNHNELWENDFDLDDWDWGFVSDTYWNNNYNPDNPDNSFEFWLLNHMYDYYTGYKVTYYKDKLKNISIICREKCDNLKCSECEFFASHNCNDDMFIEKLIESGFTFLKSEE